RQFGDAIEIAADPARGQHMPPRPGDVVTVMRGLQADLDIEREDAQAVGVFGGRWRHVRVGARGQISLPHYAAGLRIAKASPPAGEAGRPVAAGGHGPPYWMRSSSASRRRVQAVYGAYSIRAELNQPRSTGRSCENARKP